MKREMLLVLDELDYSAIQKAIAQRQKWRCEDGTDTLPNGDSNTPGAYLAEICRGWLEMKGVQS